MSIAACRLLGPAVSSVAAAIVATPTPLTVTLLVPAATMYAFCPPSFPTLNILQWLQCLLVAASSRCRVCQALTVDDLETAGLDWCTRGGRCCILHMYIF
ncbi:hypothetical protein AURDEDRAFT_165304 [Auricularia subglabra TFB-10046 SS5]|nr:hypothetical protein AURDEDRAFT_165304 [Auricularia subglabra TFB-10046 SS5]